MTIRRTTIIDEDGVEIHRKDYKYCIFDNDKGYLFKNKAYYVKGYQDMRLSDAVKNKGDYANMHLLAEHLYKDTNMIAIYRSKKYHPANIRDMCKMLNMCEKRFKQFLDRMIKIGIIARAEIITKDSVQVQYHVNPLYFNTSKYLSPALYMMFRKQIDDHLPEWVIRRFNE